MTLIDEPITVAEARFLRRLRVAGAAALLAAALGSVWSAAPTGATPADDRGCVMDVAAATGFSHACADDRTPASAP